MTETTVLRADEARLNITYNGQNADLPDPVNVGLNDTELKGIAAEVLRSGTLEAFGAHPDAGQRIANFVIDRNAPTKERPHWLYLLRPKTPFGFSRG